MNTTKEREIEVLVELCKNCTVSWINSILKPRQIVYRVEFFMIVAAVFMIARSIGAPRRRQSQSIIIRYGVQGVFILSFPLVSYTVGLMWGQKIRNELYLVWAMFLAMLFGGANALSIQKLDESKQLMKLYCDNIVFAVYIIFVLSMFSSLGARIRYMGLIVGVFTFLLPIKYLEQWRAAVLTRKPLVMNGIRWLANYMNREHELSTSCDPRTMNGYKYLVQIHKGCVTIGGNPVTVEDIWCGGNIGVLSCNSAPIRHLKDLCLSFSMFHLVIRRYFGYTCPESNLDKTRDLVLHGLLRTEQEYERAFQVIEAELAFVYDFFFTKYAFIMYGHEVWCCALPLAFTFLSIAVGTLSLSGLNTHRSIWDDLLVETKLSDVVVTIIVLVVLSISQLLEIWFYCDSDWAKVSLVCKYITNPSWRGNARIEKLLRLLGRPRKWLRYWRNTIDQYSVLDSFDSSFWDRLKRNVQFRKTEKPVELTLEVKMAVARNMKNSINARLSNISSVLIRHGVSDELRGACQIGSEFTPSLTHIILVWHIATSYCEISEKIRYQEENNVHPNRRVATSLSKYVAYLVASAPTLLPGSYMESEITLDDLERETKEAFQNLVSPTEKYGKLIELQYLHDPRMTASTQLLNKGSLVGKHLESMGNPAMPWDLLADFWAEMMVYIAPSDNVADHIELLAEGGEFVTHVWALLMHAGILAWPAVTAATAVPR